MDGGIVSVSYRSMQKGVAICQGVTAEELQRLFTSAFQIPASEVVVGLLQQKDNVVIPLSLVLLQPSYFASEYSLLTTERGSSPASSNSSMLPKLRGDLLQFLHSSDLCMGSVPLAVC